MMSAAAGYPWIHRGLRIILAAGIVTFGPLVCRNAGCSNILFVVKVHFFRYRSIILFLHFIDSFPFFIYSQTGRCMDPADKRHGHSFRCVSHIPEDGVHRAEPDTWFVCRVPSAVSRVRQKPVCWPRSSHRFRHTRSRCIPELSATHWTTC